MEIINYIFYRLFKHYKKENPVFTAAIYITIIQISIIYFIFMMYNALFYPHRMLGKELFFKNEIFQTIGKIFTLIFYVLLQLINFLYYKNKMKDFEIKFSNHPMNKWFKLWMLYLVCLFLLFFPILVFKIRHYYNI